MGFYLRKSIRLGPLRFNLSGSGIGVSTGIRGLRVGTGPRGNYIHVGRGGLYYRQSFSLKPRNRHAKSSPVVPVQDERLGLLGPMQSISSGSVESMVDSSSATLLADLETSRRIWRMFPFVIACAAVMIAVLIAARAQMWIVLLTAVLLSIVALAAYFRDILRKSVVMMYDLDSESADAYQQLHESLGSLTRSGGAWHVGAKQCVLDQRYFAGAGQVATRTHLSIAEHCPPFVRTNVPITRVAIGKGSLYFCPDTVLIYLDGRVGSVSYDELHIRVASSRFVEDGPVPRDAKLVDRTWQYVNKDGGPDRRFKVNRQLPICEYEEVSLQTNSGLNELLLVSRLGTGDRLIAAVQKMATTLASAKIAATSANTSPPAQSRVCPPVMAVQTKPRSAPPAKAVSIPRPLSPPWKEDIHESLFRILCCVMVSDCRASSAEKKRIAEIMQASGASWDSDVIAEKVAKFISEVQQRSFNEILAKALLRVPRFKSAGRQDILLKCVNSLAAADSSLTDAERAIVHRIQGLAGDSTE